MAISDLGIIKGGRPRGRPRHRGLAASPPCPRSQLANDNAAVHRRKWGHCHGGEQQVQRRSKPEDGTMRPSKERQQREHAEDEIGGRPCQRPQQVDIRGLRRFLIDLVGESRSQDHGLEGRPHESPNREGAQLVPSDADSDDGRTGRAGRQLSVPARSAIQGKPGNQPDADDPHRLHPPGWSSPPLESKGREEPPSSTLLVESLRVPLKHIRRWPGWLTPEVIPNSLHRFLSSAIPQARYTD